MIPFDKNLSIHSMLNIDSLKNEINMYNCSRLKYMLFVIYLLMMIFVCKDLHDTILIYFNIQSCSLGHRWQPA